MVEQKQFSYLYLGKLGKLANPTKKNFGKPKLGKQTNSKGLKWGLKVNFDSGITNVTNVILYLVQTSAADNSARHFHTYTAFCFNSTQKDNE